MRATMLLATTALLFAQGAADDAVRYPLAPGVITGAVNNYTAKPGDTVARLAPGFGVHPIRIRKPSEGLLKDGLQPGETIFVDQRHIMPAIYNWVEGIVLNVPEAHVYVVEGGRIVKDYPVAVSRSDWKVPLGKTQVVDKTENPTWYVPESIQREMAKNGREVKTRVEPGPDNPLGTRWIGFADGTYGFHGTTAPNSIKTYASHGCVRFLRRDIEDLYSRVKVGTPVRIYYQPLMMAVDEGAVWVSAYPDIYELGFDYEDAVRTLAAQAKVSQHLNWETIKEAITSRDGIPRNVSRPSEPRPRATGSPDSPIDLLD
ncbi:MAG: L,D-transpeptidase [Candidatus Sericytochromatia bacterium]